MIPLQQYGIQASLVKDKTPDHSIHHLSGYSQLKATNCSNTPQPQHSAIGMKGKNPVLRKPSVGDLILHTILFQIKAITVIIKVRGIEHYFTQLHSNIHVIYLSTLLFM